MTGDTWRLGVRQSFGGKEKKDQNGVQSIMNRLSSTKLCSGLGLSLALLGTTVKAEDTGAVYTSDNSASANHVLVFQRAENGQVTSAGGVATGGTGRGAGLSHQSAVLLSH